MYTTYMYINSGLLLGLAKNERYSETYWEGVYDLIERVGIGRDWEGRYLERAVLGGTTVIQNHKEECWPFLK